MLGRRRVAVKRTNRREAPTGSTAWSYSSGTHKPVVFVGPDPDPYQSVGFQPTQGAIMVAHADAEAVLTSLQAMETERRMMRVWAPEVVVLNGQFLNVSGQRSAQIPEPQGRKGFHCRGGQSRRSPCADSLSPSSNKKSSLPADKSRSICSSQRVCSRARNHSMKRRWSSGGKLLIAASISSTGPYLEFTTGFGLRHANILRPPPLGWITRQALFCLWQAGSLVLGSRIAM